jgi:hypothetical protein
VLDGGAHGHAADTGYARIAATWNVPGMTAAVLEDPVIFWKRVAEFRAGTTGAHVTVARRERGRTGLAALMVAASLRGWHVPTA